MGIVGKISFVHVIYSLCIFFFFLLFHLVRLPIIESDLAVPDVIQETGRIG